MPEFDEVQLDKLVADYCEGTNLTPTERAEVTRIAKGMTCKQSADVAGISPDTVRARRKRVYRKLDLSGGNSIIAELLAAAIKRMAA